MSLTKKDRNLKDSVGKEHSAIHKKTIHASFQLPAHLNRLFLI